MFQLVWLEISNEFFELRCDFKRKIRFICEDVGLVQLKFSRCQILMVPQFNFYYTFDKLIFKFYNIKFYLGISVALMIFLILF